MIHFSNVKFKELMKIPENKKCFDCENVSCQWASVNNGIFLCTNCSGFHRGLGVEKSYIKSIVWDNWTDNQIEFMKQGGNKNLKELLQNYFDKNSISREKFYDTKIMEYYRKYLKSKVENNILEELPPSKEEAFQESSSNININNENKFSSIGSQIDNNLDNNNISFQDNIKNWIDNTYEGAKDKFNKLELGNKITYAGNTIIDTGNKIIEKTQIKNFVKKTGDNISYYFNWFLGNNNNNENNNIDKQSQTTNNIIINDKINNETITNNDSKENIKNDINVNYFN